MNSRRGFLIKGSLAATALLVSKPFGAIAGIASRFAGFTGRHNTLVFLHTSDLNPVSHYRTIQYIAQIKKNNANAMLLNAGNDIQDDSGELDFDASVKPGSLSEITGDYRIINKAGIRTGIISSSPGEANVVKKVNDLSSYLKKEKNCQVVVCLSQLGYKNKNAPDDITLASASTCLDIIIGGHISNFASHPIIALNNNKGEVIIHSAAGNNFGVGKIEIDFDEKGRKRRIDFSDSLLKTYDKSRRKLTA